MKRLSIFFIFLILFMICAPVFSLAASAPFSFSTSQDMPVNDSNKWYYVFASNENDGVLAVLDSSILSTYVRGGLSFPSLSDRPSMAAAFSASSGNYTFNLSFYDLKNGYLLSTETATVSISKNSLSFWYPDRIFSLSNYISSPAYAYQLFNSPLYNNLGGDFVPSDPFVNWSSSGGGGGGDDPGPVDPTSVIRSLIPRPFGTGCNMYIADHLYLYSIFVGVPQQFEFNGHISTDDPNHFYGDNYNVFDVTFSASGSNLNFVVTNRATFSYNVIVTKYDVVDGSLVSSSVHAVTAATNTETPGVSRFSISLSDPLTFGIYQSGFFARSQSVSFPELRISWSDTIDYSLDFFVIRQGLVTIVEGINTTNSSLATANSTLSSISSTSQQILSQLQSFYTLCDTNFTWFKTTYFNSILNRWDINKTQLDTIISLLEGNGQTTYPENESVSDSVDSYVSQEDSYFQQFDEAGSNADAVFDEAISQFTANSNGFSFIRMLLETFVFNIPSSYIIVFVSLTFGLVIMIIGRVVGGKA